MDSTHQELYFLLLSASQLSKRSSGGLGEVKKTVDGNTKIAFPEICPAAATVIDCWNCCWPSQEHKIWATSQSQPLNHPPLSPRLPIVWNFQSVNNGGEECFAIGSIILWTKLISGLESEDLQFYVLNYENVICSLTRISHSMTFYRVGNVGIFLPGSSVITSSTEKVISCEKFPHFFYLPFAGFYSNRHLVFSGSSIDSASMRLHSCFCDFRYILVPKIAF